MPSTLLARLDTIRSKVSLHVPFYSAVGAGMFVEEAPVGTAGVNATHIYFDPDFCGLQDDKQIAYLYCHEIGHKALLHAWRRGGRHPGVWNAACDYVINNDLEAMHSPILRRPVDKDGKPSGLVDPRFTGMSEEEVYRILMDEGGAEMWPSPSDLMDDTSGRGLADMEIEMINIAKAAKMAGASGGMIDMILKRSHVPRPRWKDVLRDFFTSVTKAHTNWRRPSRRSSAVGVVLPSLHSPAMGSIVFFGDVSGSMVPIVQKLLGEMQGIVDEVHPESVHAVFGDTRVTLSKTLGPGEVLSSLQIRGGGGTDFRPLFKEVETQGWRPMCGVFLTDTYGIFPAVPPNYPVIWGVMGAAAKEVSVPWGQVVDVEHG